MLNKLIKYDLKWLLKVILIFHGIGLFFGIIGRLTELLPDSPFFIFISKFCKGVCLSLIITGLVNCIIRSWVRFILNMYKDESYLTHTLPVNKNTHLLSKVLSSIIIVVISVVILLIGLFIMYYNKETLESLKLSLNILSSNLGISVIGLLLLLGIVLLTEIIFIILIGYFGIVYGYSHNYKKPLKTFIYGGVSYLVFNVTTVIMLLIGSLFNNNLKAIVLGGSTQIEFNVLVGILWFAFIVYVVYSIIVYLLMNNKFNKGVNID